MGLVVDLMKPPRQLGVTMAVAVCGGRKKNGQAFGRELCLSRGTCERSVKDVSTSSGLRPGAFRFPSFFPPAVNGSSSLASESRSPLSFFVETSSGWSGKARR